MLNANNTYFENLKKIGHDWEAARAERQARKQPIIDTYGWESEELKAWYAEDAAAKFPFESGVSKAYRAWAQSLSRKEDELEMDDFLWDKEVADFIDALRSAGITSFVYTKNKLIWFGDKDKTLAYTPQAGEMILTVHRWFANKSCPGNWMYARMGDLAAKVTAQLGGSGEMESPVKTTGLQASALKGLSEGDAIKKVGPLCTADMKTSGILASVTLAQFILESGYGKSELAQGANNVFGMKKSLSGNTWAGSAWDGKSIYTKKTQEQNADGSYVTITADFRKYPCIEDSIADHSAYLLGAMNGSKARYAGLKGCTDYKKAVQIIKDGGYATSLTYVEKLCSIIERWNLTRYDAKSESTPATKPIVERTIRDITKENQSQVPRSMGSNKIEFIVVHYLGVPNADNPNLYGGGYGGHYNIKRDGSIYKAADPKTAVVWHCGGGLQGSGGHSFYQICTNFNSIGSGGMTQRVSLSIEQWIALREGGTEAPPIWFTVVGGSMRPLIRVNRDQVMLVSVAPEDIRVGDIVLFPGHFQTANYCLHRVYKLDGDRVQTFGDGLPKPDGWFPRSRILGKAKLIKRGKRTIDCDDPKWRRRAARWVNLWRIRPLLMLPHRAVDKIERTMRKTKAHG